MVTPSRTSSVATWLSWCAGGLAAAWLVGWVPHFLTWPWWIDLDTYVSIAQGWTRGRVPYRDVVVFNFPGQIYLFWLLGMLFGWGQPTCIYAFDAALLLALLAVVLWWSGRVFGTPAPGWIGVLAILSYYLSQDYRTVAQRDWHGPILATVSLFILQASRGRLGLVVSGVTYALGLLVRPHVALLLPAILAMLSRGTASDAASARRGSFWRSARLWSCLVAAVVLLGFLPIVVSGALGDFIRSISQVGYGSHYAQKGRFNLLNTMAWQLGLLPPDPALREPTGWVPHVDRLKLIPILCATALVAWKSRNAAIGRIALPWLIASVCMLAYAPLHPMRHLYLTHPLRLVAAVDLAIVTAAILGWAAPASRLRFALLAMVVLSALWPGWPRFCQFDASFGAIGGLARGRQPARVPPGAASEFAPGDPRSPYTWRDYTATLAYLRSSTTMDTPVANLLRYVPFPACNGPVGRVTPLPAEGGVVFLYSVDPQRESAYCAALEAAPAGTVAVWDSPQPTYSPALELRLVAQLLRREFRPEARIGGIEIWRKPPRVPARTP